MLNKRKLMGVIGALIVMLSNIPIGASADNIGLDGGINGAPEGEVVLDEQNKPVVPDGGAADGGEPEGGVPEGSVPEGGTPDNGNGEGAEGSTPDGNNELGVPVPPVDDGGQGVPAPPIDDGGQGVPAPPADENSDDAPESLVITVTGFEKLEKNIRYRRVSAGTTKEQLNLPTSLIAYTDEKSTYGTGTGTITIENISWESNPEYNGDVEGRYVFSPKFQLPAGCVIGENVKVPTIEVYVSEFKEIRYEDHGSHYAHFINSYSTGEEMLLYGMNFNLNYAHPSPVWGDTVPKYTGGYLNIEDFRTPTEYFEFLERAAKLLFAGYPNNGANLYQIVSSNEHQVTIADFNKMLVPPAELTEVFPELKHHVFEYPLDSEKTKIIVSFVNRVLANDFAPSASGIDREAITSMPFYKAATCFVFDSDSSPFDIFKESISNEYYMTREVAYLSTQHAFSLLLDEFGIPHNKLDHPALIGLPNALLEFAKKGEMAIEIPRPDAIGITGEISFSYNPSDNLWYSDPIMIHEPSDYNGKYTLVLPEGVRMLHNINYVYADEKYRLVSDHELTQDEVIAATTEIPWLRVFEQFGPENILGKNGKAFEGMAGAIAEKTPLRFEFPHATKATGKLNVSADVVGRDLESREFDCRLEVTRTNLNGANSNDAHSDGIDPNSTKLNGTYGDVVFVDGIANFTLKKGETKEIAHLPEGSEYIITSLGSNDFSVKANNCQGVIEKNLITSASFTYITRPDLTIENAITGDKADKTKAFNFEICLKDEAGNPVTGQFEYTASKEPNGNTEPDQNASASGNKSIVFVDGKAEIELSHHQVFTIKNLSYNCHYVVKVTDANKDGYETIYNGHKDDKNATGTLIDDMRVSVEITKGVTGSKPESDTIPPMDDSDKNPPVQKPDPMPPVNESDKNPPVQKPDPMPPVNEPDKNPPVQKPDPMPPMDDSDKNPPVQKPDLMPPVNEPDKNPPVQKPDPMPPVNEPDKNPPVQKPDPMPPVDEPDKNPPVQKPDPIPPVNEPDTKSPTNLATGSGVDLQNLENQNTGNPNSHAIEKVGATTIVVERCCKIPCWLLALSFLVIVILLIYIYILKRREAKRKNKMRDRT